jgi:hypothetical protein
MPRRKNKGPDDRLTKAGFVRSLPADMPPKEVAEKAKEAGLPLSSKNVSTIRAKDRARTKSPAKKVPQKRGPKKKGPRTGITKTAYVMGLPLTLSAREVVAEAKSKGIVLTEKHVSVIRSVAKKKNLLLSSKKKGGAGLERGSVRVSKSAGRLSPEDLLRAAVLAVGLPRATALVAEENRKLHLLLAG